MSIECDAIEVIDWDKEIGYIEVSEKSQIGHINNMNEMVEKPVQVF